MTTKVRGHYPEIAPSCYIADSAEIIGQVKLGENTSVWPKAVLRGDVMPIEIGKECSIQDGTVVHGTFERCGVRIGDRVTVGHSVLLHGCEVGDNCLIGMGSIIMDHARIGNLCIVGAGSLVTEKSEFADGSLILGRPAKKVRDLTAEEKEKLLKNADKYLLYKTWYEKES